MAHALVLNATYEPLCVVPQRRALVLVLAHKAVTLEDAGAVVHSATAALDVPSVVRLLRFVRVPYRSAAPLTRRAIFARDAGRCAYCGAAANTVDHVVPRSRGGRHAWDNVVAACHRCNHVKGDRLLAELGWRLRTPAVQPTGAAWRILGTGRSDPHWAPYLAAFGGEELEDAPATA
ncbi:MAG TPA: HNH endonuclease [Motilibacteraceae bacterium]|nr:HNH endonuclease [Motilibacteraceae bacterium]